MQHDPWDSRAVPQGGSLPAAQAAGPSRSPVSVADFDPWEAALLRRDSVDVGNLTLQSIPYLAKPTSSPPPERGVTRVRVITTAQDYDPWEDAIPGASRAVGDRSSLPGAASAASLPLDTVGCPPVATPTPAGSLVKKQEKEKAGQGGGPGDHR